MKICGYCGRENAGALAACESCGHEFLLECAPPALLPPLPKHVCPACGAGDNFKPATVLRSSFSLPVFVAGGLLAVMFYNASHKKRVQCNGCGALFNVRSFRPLIPKVIFWLLVSPTVIMAGLLVFALLRWLLSPGAP